MRIIIYNDTQDVINCNYSYRTYEQTIVTVKNFELKPDELYSHRMNNYETYLHLIAYCDDIDIINSCILTDLKLCNCIEVTIKRDTKTNELYTIINYKQYTEFYTVQFINNTLKKYYMRLDTITSSNELLTHGKSIKIPSDKSDNINIKVFNSDGTVTISSIHLNKLSMSVIISIEEIDGVPFVSMNKMDED